MNLQHQESTSILRSERGQIAIFIALIFQVLFVFFAMIVNIGLIVHDKINLQNSVDLAAYYAAQRQAEILNAIAHENYKIRQAWKLLSWRTRVLGDMGFSGHPLQDASLISMNESAAFGNSSSQRSNRLPVVCISHGFWGMNQNLCYKNAQDIRVPELPDYNIINVFSPVNIIFKGINDYFRDVANDDGTKTGPLNFGMAMRWAAAYRTQVSQSKEAIRAYAALLSSNTQDFNDLSGNSTYGGTRKTLERNLTRANTRSLANGDGVFKIYNSLGAAGDRKAWLNEVPIFPLIYYVDFYKSGSTWRGEAKVINGVGSTNRPRSNSTPNTDDDNFRNEPKDPEHLYHSMFGVEKNPWMMAYVGVYAETKPQKPYLPFGEPITLRAKAFAKPFGGRIGPWYYSQWPRGSLKSNGSTDQRVDGLTPIPMELDKAPNYAPGSQELAVPNYSRFPGDKLGLASRAALSSFAEKLRQTYKSGMTLNPVAYGAVPSGGDGLAMAPQQDSKFNITLKNLGYAGPWIREFEVAAIAPDIFDITYYSIDQGSYQSYTQTALAGKIITNPVYDIGTSAPSYIKSVADQISISQALADPRTFWTVKDVNQLLTSWAPAGAFNYAFPDEVFGKCYSGKAKENTPGLCARGGRTGYSVKIISEEYLKSNLNLGGSGNSGSLINPPPDHSNW